MRPDEFLDSMLDEAMASLPPVQPNSLSQAGAGSAFADTQSKRRHSQEEATQRKRVRVDPLAFLDEIAQPQADDKAAMPPVAPTASTKKVVLPAETQSQNESVPATEKSSRQFSQSFKRVEEAPAVEVDMEEAQDWKAPPEDMYRAPKPGDPGYEYLLQDPDDEEKPEVAFDDIPAGKPAKTGKKSKDLAPEKVAKLARKVAQALKDQNDVTKDEAIMEGLVGKTRVVFGAVVKEPERRPTEKKGSRKGKEKDVWGRPNFKRFRKVRYRVILVRPCLTRG